MGLTEREYNFNITIGEYHSLQRLMKALGWGEDYAVGQLAHEGLELLQLAGAIVSRRLEPAHPDAVVRALLMPVVRNRPGYSGGLTEDEVTTGAFVLGLRARENELPEHIGERGAFARAAKKAAAFTPSVKPSCVRPAPKADDILKRLQAERMIEWLNMSDLEFCQLATVVEFAIESGELRPQTAGQHAPGGH